MNKIFTLLAAAGLAMSANADVLWEGEFAMDWTVTFEDIAKDGKAWDKAAVAFQDLEEGDKLAFSYKDMSTDPDAPCQIQLATKVGPSWTWTEFVKSDPVPASGVYTYEITDSPLGDSDWTELEVFPERGICVKGQGGTLCKIELIKKNGGAVTPAEGTVIWTGSFDLKGWSGVLEYKNVADNKDWNKSVMSGLKKGDKIVVYCDPAESGAQVQFNSFALDNNWTWTTIVEYADVVGGKYTYKLTDDIFGDATDVEMVSQRGFAIKGQKATVVKIEVISAAGGNDPVTPPTPSTGEAIWEGEFPMDWTVTFEDIAKDGKAWDKAAVAFQDLEEGDKLAFSYKDMSTDPDAPCQIQLATKVGPSWTWTEFVKSDNVPESGVYTYEITDGVLGDSDYTELEVFPERGICVKGQGGTLVKVEVIKKNSAIENVAVDAVDFNAPVEIYTIEGRRVNEMTQGRIYIVRQGNKVVKIAK